LSSQHTWIKKNLWGLALLLIASIVVSACGNAATPANHTASQVEESKESVAPTTKMVTTIKGDIEIPTKPQRIVAEEYLGSLIALDVIPVGAPGLNLNNYYFKEALSGVSDIGDYGNPEIERIVALEPDLIITGNEKNYEQLSKIAPTIVVPYGDLKNVHEELTYFGQLLGVEKKAEAWLQDYDQRVAAAKAKVDAAIPAESTFSIIETSEKQIWVYGDNFGRGGQPVYQALGRKPPTAIADEIMEKQWKELSKEVLQDYVGDYIILTTNNYTLEQLQQDPIWSSLPALKKGHVYIWPEARSWYYDPLAVLNQTEELAKWLTETK
jgi:iron complex transport system substrate-binding protein